MVLFTHEQNIIYNQTKLNHIVHEQTIICTQLFADHNYKRLLANEKEELFAYNDKTMYMCSR